MPRKIGVEYPGAIYHVMSRGDRREAICLDDVDRQDFLKTLAEAEAKGQRMMREGLKRLGWKETELTRRRKNDPGKLGLALRLRRETTLSVKKIAHMVGLGTSKSANVKLHAWMKANAAGLDERRKVNAQ